MMGIATILKRANPRLVVIGGSGRLGGLLRRAWQMEQACGLAPVWQARRQEDFAATGGPDLVFDPLGAPEALRAALGAADAVLHLAGPVAGLPAQLAQNSTLARAVVAAAGGKPVLVASSAAVYGAAAGPCTETQPLAPLSPYGRAKVEMEQALAGAAGVCVLRIGNVAGADALFGAPPGPEGRVLHIFPAGHGPRRSYIGPQALARALARLVRLAVAGQPLPDCLNLALPGVVGMEALLAAAGESWCGLPAPEGAIETVEMDVGRALELGLVAETPAGAGAILADLQALRGGR